MMLGIDIGTSYSSAAVLRDGKAVPVSIGNGHEFSVPSMVYAAEDGSLLLGQAASAHRAKNPSRFRAGFKREFGTESPYLLGERELLPEDIYTEFFRYFIKLAKEQTGEQEMQVCITHPAGYGREKKLLLQKAAEYAGLMNVTLLEEPTAAALGSIGAAGVCSGETLLVFDFGGGTLDLSLLKKDDGITPLTKPLGLLNCGGVVFDGYIYQDIVQTLSKENDMEQALQNIKFRWLVTEEAIKIKHLLSENSEAAVCIPFGFGDMLDYVLTQDKFQEMIRGKVEESCELVRSIAKNAGIEISQIDKAVCVGGTTRIPYVVESLEKTLGKKVSRGASPELAVCLGAAIYGQEMQTSAALQRKEEEQKIANIDDEFQDFYEEDWEEEEDKSLYNQNLHDRNTKKGIKDSDIGTDRYNQGVQFMTGKGMKKDTLMAVAFFREATSYGSVDAMNDLGYCCYHGIGRKRDYAEAFDWFQKAAERSSPLGIFNLALCYETGHGVEKDINKAVNLYMQAAVLGENDALDRAEKLKKEIQEQSKGSLSSQFEDAQTLYNKGVRYMNGKGTVKDITMAIEYFQRAAANGSLDAMNDLGYCNYHGLGVKRDYAAAFRWFQKAAEKNSSLGIYNLALCYETGNGVGKDTNKAVKLYSQAAALGETDAKNKLKKLSKPLLARILPKMLK